MNAVFRSLLFPVATALICPAAMAQLVEEMDLYRQGNDAVLSIRFLSRVQYERSTASRSGDLVQAYYSVLPTRNSVIQLGAQRRLNGGGKVPEITVTDEAVRDSRRKLTIRFAKTVPFRLRAGKGNQSIEVVLLGLGDQVSLAQVPKIEADAPQQNFLVTLQSSSDPGFFLQNSVPAKLQGSRIFTDRRTVDGKTVHDINLGYFSTQAQADEALKQLLPRFPAARVVALKSATDDQKATAEVETKAAELLAKAQAAIDSGDFPAAVDVLGQLLSLPPNALSRKAQELIGSSRLKSGDTERARAEFEAFLNLYPQGSDSDRIRALQSTLPAKPLAVAADAAPESNWSGSVSAYYFGGKSKERDQEFQDSPISGLPELLSDDTISDTDQGQFQTGVDLNWRKRDAESDSRFVLRESYTTNFKPGKPDKNRLTALYYDQKSFTNGTNFRVGRQSPIGGGVLHRFDGLQAGYSFVPKWRINGVAGVPMDRLLRTKRKLYGAWIDAEALTEEISGSLYVNEQKIDGYVDRRAVGTELRYFSGGVSLNSQLDYDQLFKGVNIASVQGTWQFPDNSVINFLYDRRATSMLSLSNILFFQDPLAARQAETVAELVASSPELELRQRVKSVTPYQKQMMVGGTTPLSEKWQIGADLNLTNVEAVPAIPSINFEGFPSTGNLWSVGTQLIGSNLYSEKDTHVFVVTYLKGPTYNGLQMSYNNMTGLDDGWRVEPSLRYYQQSDQTGTHLKRWSPGLRLSYRYQQATTIESELTYERTKRTGVRTSNSSDRLSYFLGARYDF
jgi:tetratricopeptide (TPR) repeat protein